MKSKLIIILLFCVLTTNIAAQARGRMVVVPFSGGGNYGDFLSQYILVRTTLRTWDTVQPSQSVTDNLSRELNYFPRNGMMNINYLAALTGFYNARYAMTGNIYRIRNNTVFVISIIDTETRRLAAAEILSFENSSDGTPLRSDVDAVLPRTVDALLNGLRTNTSALPVLAVNRTATGDDIVDLLSHLLIVNLHKTGEYSISIQPTEREQRSINNILHFEVWDLSSQ